MQRVIRLVNEMEEHLVRLVRGGSSYSRDMSVTRTQPQPKDDPAELANQEVVAAGPYVPGVTVEEEVIHNQDDVDALLSSLGF